MIDEQRLRTGLQKLLKETESAIRERLEDEPSLQAQLKERHDTAVRAERTEGSKKGFLAFSDEAITQAAVHWLLGCVFVRFLEDNGWLDERNGKAAWISGPGERLAIAKDRRTIFLRPDPSLTDRDYLLHVFAEVAKLPGVAGLFDPKHNPLYSLQPTAQGAAKIVEFFQKVDPDSNALIHDFSDPAHGTRFLGDLYQNLSEYAQERYALCQTPDFVVDFILDRTLTPALDAFGPSVRLIDPSCGSGHFLLAAFNRMVNLWQKERPSVNISDLAQQALDAVAGVDLNPFAAEIAGFRMLIAALTVSRIQRLGEAPNFRLNVATGDSLLHGRRPRDTAGTQTDLFESGIKHYYETEDAAELGRILSCEYHVVVGNPPYITVGDDALREAYRQRFRTCHRNYQLGVPFTERFFDLAIHSGDPAREVAGFVGMIVSDAFMKRSFGKKLVEDYLANRDLTHLVHTSGVYLPGHGTPTVIIFGRNQRPVAASIRAVRGKKGETGVPPDPSNAPIWREIVDYIDQAGFEGSYVSIANADRALFSKHPWAVGGGGASELKDQLDQQGTVRLHQLSTEVGRIAVLGEEDAWFSGQSVCHRNTLKDLILPVVSGESVREWSIAISDHVPYPYEDWGGKAVDTLPVPSLRRLWPNRQILKKRTVFKRSIEQAGKHWWEFLEHYTAKMRASSSIALGEIATHNHFVLDRGGKVFNQTAPVIKLPADATEDQHLELLGLLNSSTACFWLKQICFPKGGDHVGTEGARVTKNQWEERYAFDSTKLKQFPIPEEKPLALTKLIQAEAEARSAVLPDRLSELAVPTRQALEVASQQSTQSIARMIALQEELDWQCYRLYSVIEDDLTIPPDQVPPLHLGERAFEIVLARSGEEAIWFERHKSKPITELPAHWPDDYRRLVERRIAVIESNRDIALIERPEYKRRWNLPSWKEMEKSALKGWLLDRVEQNSIWKDHALVSCAQLRDALARDSDWLSVAEIYHGGPVEALDDFVIALVTPETVPHLPVLRYTESGLRKRAEWEHVWELQRREDAGEKVEIPVPPKYVTKDMLGHCWRLRGGLDVPKERFILYPSFQRDSDASPVLGWAGWNHLEQAKALATYYQRMRTEEGWEPERLKPILAGLLDLKPWLLQWHNEIDPEMGERLGEYFVKYAESQCQELGFSPEEVRAWQPPATTTARRGRKKTS